MALLAGPHDLLPFWFRKTVDCTPPYQEVHTGFVATTKDLGTISGRCWIGSKRPCSEAWLKRFRAREHERLDGSGTTG